MSRQDVAIVTGAGGGIGRAIAFELARRGNAIIAVDQSADAVNGVVEELRSAGHDAQANALDISDGAALDALIGGLGRIDVIVNNAGIFEVKAFSDLTAEDYRRSYEINVIASAEIVRRALPKLDRGAAIVNIASVAMFGAFNYAHYAASKAAVGGLTRSMALEFAGRGIRANAVAPGPIKTPMLLDRVDADMANVLKRIPLGCFGEPEDIAAAVGYLASPEAKFVTGVILVVDGGRTLTGPVAS